MSDELRSFQRRLKIERESRGIIQTEMAREIGISQPHLCYIESGRRNLTQERYEMILDYFNKIG